MKDYTNYVVLDDFKECMKKTKFHQRYKKHNYIEFEGEIYLISLVNWGIDYNVMCKHIKSQIKAYNDDDLAENVDTIPFKRYKKLKKNDTYLKCLWISKRLMSDFIDEAKAKYNEVWQR